MDNPEKMNKFLERYNLPRLNHEETENMNRLMEKNETEIVANYPTFREETKPTLLKLFQEIRGTLQNSPKRPPSL